jgi:hypothetical protein
MVLILSLILQSHIIRDQKETSGSCGTNLEWSYDSATSKLTIPNSVTYIGFMAFRNCIGLTSVTFEGLFDPGSGSLEVFCNCTKLKEVNVLLDYQDETFCGESIKKNEAVSVYIFTIVMVVVIVVSGLVAGAFYIRLQILCINSDEGE